MSFSLTGKSKIPLKFLLLTSFLIAPLVLSAQNGGQSASRPTNVYGSGIGLNVALTNSGFGMGGYYMKSVSEKSSIVADLLITTIKDEREQRFFNLFGESVIPNKQNYLHILPFQIGIQRRMFKESIQDNFRPFVHATGGPTLGWVSPYYDDENENGIRDQSERPRDVIGAFPKGSAIFGVGGTLAIGAHFGISKRVTQGIRFGYTFQYFPDGVQLLEPAAKSKDKFFGTPTLTLTFGRLN